MSPTNYDYNVTFREQWFYYYSANKTGLPGYPDEVKPLTESYYLSLISLVYNIIFNSSPVSIWSYACLVTLGLIGNVVNIVVFTRPSMVGPLNFLLACLESANLIYYIAFIHRIVGLALYPNRRYDWRLSYSVMESVIDAVIFMCNWCNVTIGLFRFIAVTWPLFAKRWCSNTRAKLSALVIGLASVPVAVVLYCLYVPTPPVVAVYENEDSEAPLFFTKIYFFESIIPFEERWFEYVLESVLLLLSTAIPRLISALLSMLLIGNLCVAKRRRRKLSENRNSNLAVEMDLMKSNPEASRGNTPKKNTSDVETRVTITLLVVLFISNLSYLPTSIYYVLILIGERSILYSHMAKVSLSQIGVVFSNCLTFFVYVTMSQRFRKTLVDLVCRAFKKQAMSGQSRSRTTETNTSNL